MNNISKEQRISNILSKIELPDPFRSLEDHLKCIHDDLLEMSELELWKEEKITELSLAITDKTESIYKNETGQMIFAEEWLLERLAKIRQLKRGGY